MVDHAQGWQGQIPQTAGASGRGLHLALIAESGADRRGVLRDLAANNDGT
jgi:hypothetical protein